jgi:protein PhnA
MSLERELKARSGSKCELCTNEESLTVLSLPPDNTENGDNSLLVCGTCHGQIENPEIQDSNHWRCLNDSMWNENRAVQVMAYRMLHRLKSEGWPQDLLDMMYMEEDTLAYANAGIEDDSNKVIHRDVNGVILKTGDNVVLIKDLKVKGSSMVAKQGTPVRRISLDMENAEYIEGKVDDQHIVIITKYVKKTS